MSKVFFHLLHGKIMVVVADVIVVTFIAGIA